MFGNKKIDTSGILPYGIIGGIIVGVLFTITFLVFNPLLPAESIPAIGKLRATNIIGLLNEGVTWEIINRFGIMTLLVWVIYKISGKLNPAVYWSAIILMFLLFGLISFLSVSEYTPAIAIIFHYIIRAIGVFIYGWLYWKKGLETAIVANIFAYITMMIGDMLFIASSTYLFALY